jgi:plasmid stabilization system protein ParE
LAFQFWLESRTLGLRIAQFPYQFSLLNGTVRRARLKRFPYAMYYQLESEMAFVIAVLHQRRSDDVWRQRSRRTR